MKHAWVLPLLFAAAAAGFASGMQCGQDDACTRHCRVTGHARGDFEKISPGRDKCVCFDEVEEDG